MNVIFRYDFVFINGYNSFDTFLEFLHSKDTYLCENTFLIRREMESKRNEDEKKRGGEISFVINSSTRRQIVKNLNVETFFWRKSVGKRFIIGF